MLRALRIGIACAAAVLILQGNGRAAIISFNFSGGVTSFNGPGSVLQSFFQIGDPVSGSFSFDPSVIGTFTTTKGHFIQPLSTQFNSNVDGDTFDRGSFYRTETTMVTGFHALQFLTFNPVQSFPLPSGYRLSSMSLDFHDTTGAALSSLAMPNSINLGDWTSVTLKIQLANAIMGTVDSELIATIDSLAVTSEIPEPGSLTLLTIGLAGVRAATRRRRAQFDSAC